VLQAKDLKARFLDARQGKDLAMTETKGGWAAILTEDDGKEFTEYQWT